MARVLGRRRLTHRGIIEAAAELVASPRRRRIRTHTGSIRSPISLAARHDGSPRRDPVNQAAYIAITIAVAEGVTWTLGGGAPSTDVTVNVALSPLHIAIREVRRQR